MMAESLAPARPPLRDGLHTGPLFG